MKTARRIGVLAVIAVGLGSPAATAVTANVPDLPESYIFSAAGKLTPLRSGLTYWASQFPLPVRVTPTDGSWTGAQWKANTFSPDEIRQRHLKCSTERRMR
jgi:hypothetical protein